MHAAGFACGRLACGMDLHAAGFTQHAAGGLNFDLSLARARPFSADARQGANFINFRQIAEFKA